MTSNTKVNLRDNGESLDGKYGFVTYDDGINRMGSFLFDGNTGKLWFFVEPDTKWVPVSMRMGHGQPIALMENGVKTEDAMKAVRVVCITENGHDSAGRDRVRTDIIWDTHDYDYSKCGFRGKHFMGPFIPDEVLLRKASERVPHKYMHRDYTVPYEKLPNARPSRRSSAWTMKPSETDSERVDHTILS